MIFSKTGASSARSRVSGSGANTYQPLAMHLAHITRAALLTLMLLALPVFSSPAAAQAPSMLDEPVTQISGGSSHSCALTTAGAVKCWGRNLEGQLGDNSTANRLAPVDVVGLGSGLAAITTGSGHTCGLTTAGAVKCWGNNIYGQLGDGSTTQRLTPVDVGTLGSGVVAISAGGSHTCALTTAGAVKCWGDNTYGQLGDNSTTDRSTPVNVAGLGSGVAAISAGLEHTCALTAAGAVKCWGRNSEGQLGDNSTTRRLTPVDVVGLSSGVTAISAGYFHSCAVTTVGAAKCWGANINGQLGDNSVTQRLTPVDVVSLGSGVVGISVGRYHTCALTTAGAAKCWGSNSDGQLGDNSTTERLTPVDVVSLGSGAATIDAGQYQTCALTTLGAVKCWGRNTTGQLGDSTATRRLTPVDVFGLGSTTVTAITAGDYHSCASTTAGRVNCWGYNSDGQLGDNSTTRRLTPVNVAGVGGGIAAISAGSYHSCALTTGGAVQCWGNNFFGQLGDNSTTNRLTPVSVAGLGSGVTAISTGSYHTCALITGGAVKCWGNNLFGQLGDNTTTQRLTPVDVAGLGSGVTAITAGGSHTCALITGGAVKCWGDAAYGQVGDNGTTPRLAPVDVVDLGSGVTAISAGGGDHTCALTSFPFLFCWGRNDFGQLGNNSTTNRLTPDIVVGMGGSAVAFNAGRSHTCAVTTSNAAKCWGNNANGQLGDNSTTQRSLPVDVVGLTSGVAAINAGGYHTCALTATRTVKCWGNNADGQLGDNSQTQRLTPATIRSSQSISFSPPASALNGATLSLTATASSGMAVTFDSWTPTTCNVSGSALTLTSAAGGLCGVRASQPGAAPLPAGGSVAPAPQQLRLIQILLLPTLDIDDSAPTSQYDAASDGLLLLRYLFGYRDAALIDGAISPSAQRNATQIAAHIVANLTRFDVDGDGQTLALTDGVMILRRLLGITQLSAITQGVKNSARSDADVVLAIDALKP